MSSDDAFALRKTHARLIASLYARSNAEHWSVSEARFGETLHRSCCSCFRDGQPDAGEVATYLKSLRVEDLALAVACRDGHEAAWEHFVAHLRPHLHRAARAIVGHEGATELADSLYAELFGLEVRHGERRSLFEYFHGRSSLSTWLRAVLAQRHVDNLRGSRRVVPLADDELETLTSTSDPPDPDRARYTAMVQSALADSLASLESRDRLRLSYYYVQELTLAQIGRAMGEHEATVSRKLKATRLRLSAEVDRGLREVGRLTDEQVRLCYQYALEQWPFDFAGVLTQETE